MNKKIMSVFICLLFIGMIPVVAGINNYADEPEGEPIIKLELSHPPYLSPFLRIFILNMGDANATDVEWNIKWYGGWILGERFNKKARIDTGGISVLPPEITFSVSPIKFGLGRVAIIIFAECTEGSSDKLVIEAVMCGFFLMIPLDNLRA